MYTRGGGGSEMRVSGEERRIRPALHHQPRPSDEGSHPSTTLQQQKHERPSPPPSRPTNPSAFNYNNKKESAATAASGAPLRRAVSAIVAVPRTIPHPSAAANTSITAAHSSYLYGGYYHHHHDVSLGGNIGIDIVGTPSSPKYPPPQHQQQRQRHATSANGTLWTHPQRRIPQQNAHYQQQLRNGRPSGCGGGQAAAVPASAPSSRYQSPDPSITCMRERRAAATQHNTHRHTAIPQQQVGFFRQREESPHSHCPPIAAGRERPPTAAAATAVTARSVNAHNNNNNNNNNNNTAQRGNSARVGTGTYHPTLPRSQRGGRGGGGAVPFAAFNNAAANAIRLSIGLHNNNSNLQQQQNNGAAGGTRSRRGSHVGTSAGATNNNGGGAPTQRALSSARGRAGGPSLFRVDGVGAPQQQHMAVGYRNNVATCIGGALSGAPSPQPPQARRPRSGY